MRLPRGWYAVFESHQFRRDRIVAARRFSVDMVGWRDDLGAPVLQEDRCPHRSARLSLGTLERNTIVCPFHGFAFDSSGTCRHIPEIRRGSDRVRVHTFPTREAHGLIWVFWGPANESSLHDIPWFENIAENYVSGGFQVEWPTHYTRAVENQLDYAHLPYVHRTTIGRLARGGPPPQVKCSTQAVFWSFAGREGFIEFRFPNVWQNCLNANLSLSLCFVPIDENRTGLILRTHARSRLAKRFRPLFMAAFEVLNRVILAQDRRVVLSQRPENSMDASHELLMSSDRAIRWFRDQVASQAWQPDDSGREGAMATVTDPDPRSRADLETSDGG